ncbi:MAG TPA: hypothetical protein VJ746_16130 [Nitrospira sp.]|nr:hypothetical protein [Nitrospira sp.]
MSTVLDRLQTIETYKWGSKIVCPFCASLNCRRASRQGCRDLAHSLLGIFPWRCEACWTRFYLRRRVAAKADTGARLRKPPRPAKGGDDLLAARDNIEATSAHVPRASVQR